MKTEAHWEKIGKIPHHGISIPLFSLKTRKNCGIGEFLDLIPLIDWCNEVGFDCLQLLPINDSGKDPSPYNPLSSCALDPIYLSMWELGIDFPKDLQNEPRIIRENVLRLKKELLFIYFEKEFENTAQTTLYQTFLNEHSWIETYAQFKALKDQYGGNHWKDWEESASVEPKWAHFYTFLQFHAFRQMEMVKKYSEKKRIKLKGDIPVLLSPDSADVWAEPHYFNLDVSAGAPPDQYHPEGQNWGFPLIDWKAMQADQFEWWKMRLKTAKKLYHIYRMDHVVGFFRIWGIPLGCSAKEGSFFPSNRNLWEAQGTALLEMMVDASPLLPMAEDLGTVPKEVYSVLKKLGICGTKVMRWEKSEKGYIPLNEYEPMSMTTLSTHDLDPLELWWKKYPAESVPFAKFLHIEYHPTLTVKERMRILQASHHTSSLFHINALQEYLALFPELVSLNPEDERINVPGTQLPTNWTYRFRPFIEEMAAHKLLNESTRLILRPNQPF